MWVGNQQINKVIQNITFLVEVKSGDKWATRVHGNIYETHTYNSGNDTTVLMKLLQMSVNITHWTLGYKQVSH